MNPRVVPLLVAVVLFCAAGFFMLVRSSRPDPAPAGIPEALCVKQAVIPPGSSPPVGPYTPAVQVGNMLFLSGQIGLDPASGEMVEGGTIGQARQAMENLRTLLTAAGLDFSDVVRATVYLADLDEYAAFNAEYARYFSTLPPARVCIEVARLPLDARVEISMIAVASDAAG